MVSQAFQELGGYKSESNFELPAFWKHSVDTAFIARVIAQKLKAEVELCNHLSYGSLGEVVIQEPGDPVLSKTLWKLGVGPNAFDKLIEMGEAQLEDADSFLAALSGG